MINDLDKTLDQLLRAQLPSSIVGQVAISFSPPDSDFPPSSVKLPAIDLFLYDIRENQQLRETGWVLEPGKNGPPTRRRPAIRVDCSYLITAWPSESTTTPAFEEHLLLSEVIKVLVRYPTIPAQLLQGSLEGQELPLPTSSLHAGRLQSLAEFWQALGGKPKAALNYTVTIGIPADLPVETETVVVDKSIGFYPDLKEQDTR